MLNPFPSSLSIISIKEETPCLKTTVYLKPRMQAVRCAWKTGKTCALANGSCWVTYGETVVMANVTMSAKPREGVDFFPLSVDYEEKLYSVGKIPGSFLKREGRPSENAILTSRMIDRPMRPLFPAGLRNDVSIVATVLASDIDNSPEITALIAASIAVSISDVPFNGPIAGVNVGLVDGELILNPNREQREKSDLDLTVAASAEKVVMIEAGANEVPEDIMLEAIRMAHEESKKIVAFIKGIQDKIGKEKAAFEKVGVNMDFYYAVADLVTEKVKYALDTDDKNVREARLNRFSKKSKRLSVRNMRSICPRSTKSCTSCKNILYANGCLPANGLTDAEWMKSVPLQQKQVYFRASMGLASLHADRHKCLTL